VYVCVEFLICAEFIVIIIMTSTPLQLLLYLLYVPSFLVEISNWPHDRTGQDSAFQLPELNLEKENFLENNEISTVFLSFGNFEVITFKDDCIYT
jgi:hypothetical protein